MAKKNNLDNFFREKLTGYEAPGRKGNWQLLDHLLKVRERRRRMAWRFFFGSLVLICLSVSYLVFVPDSQESKNAVANNTNSQSEAPSTPGSTEKKSDAVMNTSASENNASAKASAGSSSENENKNARSAPKNIAETAQNKNQKATSKNIIAKQAEGTTHIKGKQDKSAPAITHHEEHPAIVKADLKISHKAETQEENKKEAQEVVTTQGENKNVVEEEHPTQETVLKNEDKIEAKDSVITNSSPSATVNPSSNETSVKDSVAGDSLAVQTPPKDSVIIAAANNKRANGFHFSVHAGLNLYRTQSATLSDERHVSPLVGIELMHPLWQHFSLGLGALYSLQGGYHLSDTATQITYFLEKNVSQQVILIRKQHRVYVPLTLYYMVADKHTVSCGIQWTYLLNTVGDYSETETTSGSTTQSKRENVKGYMDGINSSAFSLSVGYRFSLSKGFDVSTRFVQELSDAYTPQYFYGVNTEPSWSLQTFLSVKF